MTDFKANAECCRILDAIPDLVLVLQADKRIVFANRAAVSRYGRIVGKHCHEVVHATKAAPDACPHSALLRDGKDVVTEVVEDRFGTLYSVSVAPLRDAEGGIHGAVHIARELTDIGRTEQELLASQTLIERTFEALDDAVLVLDASTCTVAACNNAAGRVFGCRLEELLGTGIEHLHTSNEAYGRFMQEMLDTLNASGILHCELQMRRKNGELFWSEQTATQFRDGSGNRTGIVISIRDATDRRRAQEPVWESEQRFQAALKNSPIMVAHVDKDLRYTWVYNPQPDTSPRAVIGKLDVELGDDPGTLQLAELKRNVLESGAGAMAELTLPMASGAQIFDVHAEPLLDANGRVIGVTTAAVNITMRKQIENALRRSLNDVRMLHTRLSRVREQERESLARDLHDGIGTELSALGLSLGAARMLAKEKGPPELARLLEKAEQQTEYVTRSVRHFIAELRPTVLRDYGLVPALRALSERFTKQVGATVDVEGDEGCRFSEATEIALYRIAQEALANAARHADAKHVDLALERTDRGFRLVVRDDGRGFDAENPHEATLEGGLGLIDMRERAARIGGRCDIRSLPGKGTEVVVEVSSEDSHG